MFIIAVVCDIFYAGAEKKHAKSGGTNVIMIIHAVLFALFGIGALITAVFGFVSLLLADSSDTSGSVASIISGIIIFVIYGATLLRTLRPRWLPKVTALYWIFMSVAIVASVAAGIIGPAAQARQQNQDAVVEEGLPGLASAINTYTSENSKLPASLDDLESLNDYDYDSSARKLVDENKVEFKPGDRLLSVQTFNLGSGSDSSGSQLGGANPVIYHYELCVNYKARDE